RQLLMHLRGSLDVEDDERAPFACDGDDTAPRVVEVEHDRPPPVLVYSPRRIPRCDACAFVDGRDQRLPHLEDALELVEEPVGRLASAPRLRESRREPRDRLGVAAALGRLLFRRDDARSRRDEEVPLLPAPDEDGSRHEGENRERQNAPRVEAPEELVVRELFASDQRSDRPDEDEDEPHAKPEPRKTIAPTEELGRERERDAEIERRQDEKRHDLEQDDSTVVTHWAP